MITKSLLLPCMLLLCSACVPLTSPGAEFATAPITTVSPAPTQTSLPTASATPLSPSQDPISWIPIDNVVISEHGPLYVSGFTSDGDGLRHFAQWDGHAWTELGTGFRTAGNPLAVDARGNIYTEFLMESTQGSATAIMKWDGDGWGDITGGFNGVVDSLRPGRVSSNVPVTALELDAGNNLLAGGMFYYPSPDQTAELPMGYVAMWSASDWTVLGEGFDKVNVFALAASPFGEVYVSGEQPLTVDGESGFIAVWDGVAWTQIDTGFPDISLYLESDPSGGFYAAGQRNVGSAFVGHWNGTHWTTLADHFAGEAPAIFDMAVDANGHLCIGGSFESVNGIAARNIACWDGTRWLAVADGVNERVLGVAFDPSGDLYAVGYFTEASGHAANHIARWDGTEWDALE